MPIAYLKNEWMQEKPLIAPFKFTLQCFLGIRSSSDCKHFSSVAFHFRSQFWVRMTNDSGCYGALTLHGWNPFREAEPLSIFNWDLLRTQLNNIRIFTVLMSEHTYFHLYTTFPRVPITGYLFNILRKSLRWIMPKLQRNLSKRCHACLLHLEAVWIKELESC